MASKGKSKIISKDDLRRLMKETRGSAKKETKKIDSPLAKYNSLGNLICIVCNSQVKSELLWNAHLQGRTHKENVVALKARQEEKNTPTVAPPSAVKRRADGDPDAGHKKKKKKGLPDDGVPAPKPLKGILKKPKLAGDYESSSEGEEEDMAVDEAPAAAPVGSTNTGTVGSLPADFFDSGVAPSSSTSAEETAEVPKEKTMAEKLPEGFFDNPKQDAKVRQVEYKDKMDEEWELFTRVMKEESVISEAIVEEEEEEKMTEKTIAEIDDQMQRWSRVDQLHQKKEKMRRGEAEAAPGGDSDSDVDDAEFEQFLDWRSKNAWKS